jgi:hypothetical protein
MTLKYAYSRAVKRPLNVDDSLRIEDQAQQLLVNVGGPNEWTCVGPGDGDAPDGVAEVVCLAHPVNAALLAHAFNVLPEVVGALAAARAFIADDGTQGGRKWTLDAIRTALDKANTVNV